MKMKYSLTTGLTATILVFGLVDIASASLSAINIGDFSGSEAVIDFSVPAIDESLIDNQYLSSGVTFSGAIFTMQNPGDISAFPDNGDGQIASNWKYEDGGPQGDTITIDFSIVYNKIGFESHLNQDDTLSIEAYKSNGVST